MCAEKCEQRDLTMIQSSEILRHLFTDDVEDHIDKEAWVKHLKRTENMGKWIREQLKDIEDSN